MDNRSAFVEFWRSKALLPEVDISEIDYLLEEDLESWLVESALRSTRVIIEEWGIRLPEREGRATPELLKELLGQFATLRENYEHSVSVLCSFPSLMRKHQMFNCIGGSLLTLSLLRALAVDDADILLLSPVHHVLIGVRSGGRSLFLFDLRNGVAEEVLGETVDFPTGEDVFVARRRVMDFQYFPIVPISSLAEMLLGNLDTIKGTVDGPPGGFFDRSMIMDSGDTFLDYLTSSSYLNPLSLLKDTLCSRISKLPLMDEELREVERIRSERSKSRSAKGF